MAFPAGTINLKAAQSIFLDCEIEPIEVGAKTVAYKAKFNGQDLQEVGLTDLCRRLWNHALNAQISEVSPHD